MDGGSINLFIKQTFVVKSILFALGSIALCFFGAYLYQKLTNLLLRRKLKKRFDHARHGEKSAHQILKEQGYDLEESQKGAKLPMWVNGKQFLYLVRPDAFAIKEGKRYLVEIKTGKVATDPKHSATRRQLLEYYHGFDVEGVLLVDAEVQRVHDICFKQKSASADEPIILKIHSKRMFLFAFLLGALVVIVITYLNHKAR